MSMTKHGINLKAPLDILPTERLLQQCRRPVVRPEIPSSKPRPSKRRKPYFYNPSRD